MATVRRSALAALAALAVVAAPASTLAADTYLALKGGVWAPTAQEGISGIQGITSGKLPTSGDVELAYGATLGIIGAQIAGGYMWSDSNGVKLNMVPLYALGQLRLPIFFIQPYLELGIGGLANFASVPVAGGSASTTKWSFVAIGGAGVDFMLGPILLGAEARYMYISEQTFDWGSLKLSGVNVTINVGYIF